MFKTQVTTNRVFSRCITTYSDVNYQTKKFDESYLSQADAISALDKIKTSFLHSHFEQFVKEIKEALNENYYHDTCRKKVARKVMYEIETMLLYKKMPEIIQRITSNIDKLKLVLPSERNKLYKATEKRLKEILSFSLNEKENLSKTIKTQNHESRHSYRLQF